MELFRDAKIDWLGRKWYFLSFSLIFSVAGILSMLFWHKIPLGVDFKGGTQIQVQFASTPSENHIRQALSSAGVKDSIVYPIYNAGESANTEIISLPKASDTAQDAGRTAVENALSSGYHDSAFTIQKVDIVGPTAGTQLQPSCLHQRSCALGRSFRRGRRLAGHCVSPVVGNCTAVHLLSV